MVLCVSLDGYGGREDVAYVGGLGVSLSVELGPAIPWS